MASIADLSSNLPNNDPETNTCTSTDGNARNTTSYPLEGGCDCKYIRYRMLTKPLVTHCCYCRWCQRESGSAFAVNAMIEANHVIHLGPEPELYSVPSESGDGQVIARCPKCGLALWSNYDGPLLKYMRVGTLDHPEHCPPDVHIFTMSKQPWIKLPEGVPIREKSYDRSDIWSKQSLERMEVFQEKIRNWKAKKGIESEL